MFGCRPETDRNSLKSLLHDTQKSHRFSEQIRDRFYTDTSFEKHTRVKLPLGAASKLVKPVSTAMSRAVLVNSLSERQMKEMHDDEMSLRAIEQQLEQIRLKKQMKELRARQRAEARQRFASSCVIAQAIQKFTHRRRDTKADIIVHFLRIATNKQAITAATWAIGVLRRFSLLAHAKWLAHKQYQTRLVAIQQLTLQVVQNVNQFISVFAEAEAVRSMPIQIQKQPSPHKTRNKLRAKASPTRALLSLSPAKLATSLKSDADIEPQGDILPNIHNLAANSVSVTKSIRKFASNADDETTTSIEEIEAIAKQVAKVEDNKKKDLEEAYQKRQMEMQRERLLRLRNLEKAKYEREEGQRRKKEIEDVEFAIKEKKKQDFLKMIADEQSKKARALAKAKEDKLRARLRAEKLIQREREREAAELLHMSAEDQLSRDMDIDRLLRELARLQAKKKEDEDRKSRLREEAAARQKILEQKPPEVPVAVPKRPTVPRLSCLSIAYRKEEKRKAAKHEFAKAAKKKFDELDLDKNGFLESEEIDELMVEVIEAFGASEQSVEEKTFFRSELLQRVDTTKVDKLDFKEFTCLWEEMRGKLRDEEKREVQARKDKEKLHELKALLELNGGNEDETGFSLQHHEIMVTYMMLVDMMIKDLVQEAMDDERSIVLAIARERQALVQKKIAARLIKDKAERDAQHAAEEQKRKNLEEVFEVAQKLARSAPTRAAVRNLQRKKLLARQRERSVKDKGSIEVNADPEELSSFVEPKDMERFAEALSNSPGQMVNQHDTEKVETSTLLAIVVPPQPLEVRSSIASILESQRDKENMPGVVKKNAKNTDAMKKDKESKKQKQPIRMNKKKKKEKLGRVASLLAMVYRARKCLGSEIPAKNRYKTDAEADELDDVNEIMSLSWKKFADKQKFSEISEIDISFEEEIGANETVAFAQAAHVAPPDVAVEIEDRDSYNICNDRTSPMNIDVYNFDDQDSVALDTMADCSDDESQGVETDLSWIREHVPPSKVDKFEAFSSSLELASSTERALRRVDSAAEIYTTAEGEYRERVEVARHLAGDDEVEMESEDNDEDDEEYEILLNDECNALRLRLSQKIELAAMRQEK